MEADEARYERGMRVRRAVLGDAWVDGALARQTDFDAGFQRFITETAWGTVWADPTLDRRTRSLLTIAILAALGRSEELAVHMRASQRIGVPPDEIAQALMHVAVYAGVPAANSAVALAKQVLAETAEAAAAANEEAQP